MIVSRLCCDKADNKVSWPVGVQRKEEVCEGQVREVEEEREYL